MIELKINRAEWLSGWNLTTYEVRGKCCVVGHLARQLGTPDHVLQGSSKTSVYGSIARSLGGPELPEGWGQALPTLELINDSAHVEYVCDMYEWARCRLDRGLVAEDVEAITTATSEDAKARLRGLLREKVLTLACEHIGIKLTFVGDKP